MNLFVPEFFCVSFFSDMVDFVYGRLYSKSTISQKLKFGKIWNMIENHFQSNTHLSWKFGHLWTKYIFSYPYLGQGLAILVNWHIFTQYFDLWNFYGWQFIGCFSVPLTIISPRILVILILFGVKSPLWLKPPWVEVQQWSCVVLCVVLSVSRRRKLELPTMCQVFWHGSLNNYHWN